MSDDIFGNLYVAFRKLIIGFWRLHGYGGIPSLLKAMKSKDKRISAAAGSALAGIGKSAISPLILAYPDREVGFRLMIVRTLEAIGNDAKPQIIRILRDDDPSVRQAAKAALMTLASDRDGVIALLVDILKHDDTVIRNQALEILLGCHDDPTDILMELYYHGDRGITHATAEIFRNMSGELIPGLMKLLQTDNETRRRRAAEILVAIGHEAVPALAAGLKNRSPQARSDAALALAKMGDKAGEAATALIEALEDENEDVQFRAAFALKLIGSIEYKKKANAVIERTAPPLGNLDTMEPYVADGKIKRARLLPENPIVGELGSDAYGRRYLAPEEDYRGGGMGSLRVVGDAFVVNPHIDRVVKVSGVYDRDLGLLAESIIPVD